jgi:hypothetical protein
VSMFLIGVSTSNASGASPNAGGCPEKIPLVIGPDAPVFYLIPNKAEIQRENGEVVVNIINDIVPHHKKPLDATFVQRLGLCSGSSEHLADVNFDGYQDFVIIYSTGILGNESENIWIYDKNSKVFIYSKDFEEKVGARIWLNPKKRLLLSQTESSFKADQTVTIYLWKNKNIYKVNECYNYSIEGGVERYDTTPACFRLFCGDQPHDPYSYTPCQ